MPHPHLTVETSPDGYRWLRLSRPERRNALDVSLLRAVTNALAFEPEAPVVLGSTDPRVFCAGADLTISEAERAAVSDLIYDCCETIVTTASATTRNSRLGRWPPAWPGEAPASRR